MAFLSKEDYDVQIRPSILNIIDSSTEMSTFKKAETMAISQMKNYLAGRYDMDAVFVDAPAEGESDLRDPFIVMMCIDITLYHIWTKEGANNIPQARTDRYGDWIMWLKDVQRGADCNLPLLKDDEGEDNSLISLASKNPYESQRY